MIKVIKNIHHCIYYWIIFMCNLKFLVFIAIPTFNNVSRNRYFRRKFSSLKCTLPLLFRIRNPYTLRISSTRERFFYNQICRKYTRNSLSKRSATYKKSLYATWNDDVKPYTLRAYLERDCTCMSGIYSKKGSALSMKKYPISDVRILQTF